jgi:hypothetical protein
VQADSGAEGVSAIGSLRQGGRQTTSSPEQSIDQPTETPISLSTEQPGSPQIWTTARMA